MKKDLDEILAAAGLHLLCLSKKADFNRENRYLGGHCGAAPIVPNGGTPEVSLIALGLRPHC